VDDQGRPNADPFEKGYSSGHRKRLFPIPQSAIDGASDTEEYLVQN
jgi:hypothetical protein